MKNKNKIKSFLSLLLITIVPLSIVYTFFALINLDWNVYNWGVYTHGLYGFLSASSVILSIGLFYDDSK